MASSRKFIVRTTALGTLVVAVLARAGAAEITVVDPHALPRSVASRLGATRTLSADQTDEIADVLRRVTVVPQRGDGLGERIAAAHDDAARLAPAARVHLLRPGATARTG